MAAAAAGVHRRAAPLAETVETVERPAVVAVGRQEIHLAPMVAMGQTGE